MRKWFTLAMIVVLVIPMFSETLVEAKSINKVNEELKDLDKKQSELQSERKNINDNKQEVEGQMNENLNEQASLQEQLNKIEDELANTQAQISETETEIKTTNKEINQLQTEIEILMEEIEILQEKIEKREEILKDRLRAIQENGGNVQYLSVILGSQSFSELISRSTAVNSIMDSDKNIMEEQFADQQALLAKQGEVEAKKADVEAKKADLENQKSSLLGLKNQLDEQKADKKVIQEKLVKEYEELENYNLSLEEEQQLIASQAAVIEQAKKLAEEEKGKLEREAAERKKAEREASASGSSSNSSNSGTPSNAMVGSGSGTFLWPTTSGYLTSPFRPAHRPNHNGIDIGAGKGTSVIASASGVVSTVVSGCVEGNHSCGGGYGNYVMVVHQIDGSTFATLYAHLSSVSVSTGQVVSKGQHLGGVGNTGHSFGNHLHFEVHPGGYRNPANPANYLR